MHPRPCFINSFLQKFWMMHVYNHQCHFETTRPDGAECEGRGSPPEPLPHSVGCYGKQIAAYASLPRNDGTVGWSNLSLQLQALFKM